MNTSCEHCIFSIWKNHLDIQAVQLGCYFDRLDKFGKSGVRVKKEENHYVIEDRLCNRCYNGMPEGMTVEDAALKVIEKTTLSCDLILKPQDKSELINWITVAKNQLLKPKNLIILDTNDDKEEFIPLLTNSKFKWKIIGGIERELTWDDGIDKVESEAFWIPEYYPYDPSEPEPYTPDWNSVLSSADDFVNEKMQSYFCIYGDYGVLALMTPFKYFVGESKDIVNRFLTIDNRYDLKIGKVVFNWTEI